MFVWNATLLLIHLSFTGMHSHKDSLQSLSYLASVSLYVICWICSLDIWELLMDYWCSRTRLTTSSFSWKKIGFFCRNFFHPNQKPAETTQKQASAWSRWCLSPNSHHRNGESARRKLWNNICFCHRLHKGDLWQLATVKTVLMISFKKAGRYGQNCAKPPPASAPSLSLPQSLSVRLQTT